MSRLSIWLALTAGIVSYRMVIPTETSIEEHIAGVYFSGMALLMHYLAAREKGQS